VLFGKRRAYQRKVAVAEFDAVVSGDIYVLAPRSDRLLQQLLPFLCLSERFFQHAVGTSAGSLSPRTNWSSLANFEFDLPPLDQQHRIAEILWAIDLLKSRLESTLESFQKTYNAFANERFTNLNGSLIKLGELSRRGELDIQTGPFGTVLQASSYAKAGTPIINPVNMRKHGLWVDDGPFLDEKECERLVRYRMKVGDILVGRKGDVGRAVLVTSEFDGYIVGSDIIRLRLVNSDIRPDYLYYFMLAPRTRAWISRQASGTTMPGINERLLNGIEMPLLSPDKQAEIVRSVDEMNRAEGALLKSTMGSANLVLALVNRITSER
jgi:type I restriction enzyme, S subunit